MNTIFLSENIKEQVAYYITDIDEATKTLLLETKQKRHPKEQEEAFNHLTILLGIPCKAILKLGKTSEISTSALSPYVGSFLGKDTAGIGLVGRQRELHYRDYIVTEAHQKKNAWIINRCQDTTTSVNSVISKLRKDYAILWELPLDSEQHQNLKEVFKTNITWKIKN